MHEVIITPLPAQPVILALPAVVIPVGVAGGASPCATALALARAPSVTAIRHAAVTAVKATAQSAAYAAVPTGTSGGSANVAAVIAAAPGAASPPAVTTIRNATVSAPIAAATGIAYIPGLGGALSVTSFAALSPASTNARPPAVTGGAIVNTVLATATGVASAVTTAAGGAPSTGFAVPATASAAAATPIAVGSATINAVLATGATSAVTPATPLVINTVAKLASATSTVPISTITGETVLTGGGPGTGSALATPPAVAATPMVPPAFAEMGAIFNGTGTAFNIPVAPNTVAGSLILVIQYLESGTATITAPAGFIEATNSPADNSASTQPQELRIWWKLATVADAGTYAFTASSSTYCHSRAFRFTGVIGTGTPVVATTSAVKSITTTAVTPSVSPPATADANRLWVWAGTSHGSGAFSTLTGFTEIYDSNSVFGNGNLDVQVMLQPTAGTPGALVSTFGSNASSTAWIGALVPADNTAGVAHDAGLNETFIMAPSVTGTTRSILSFGATANNTGVDNFTAIQNCINACSAGDEVFIPTGVFTVKGSSALTGKNGVSIRGQSRTGAVISTAYTAQPNACLLIPTNANDLTLSSFSIISTGAVGLTYQAGIRLGSSNTPTNPLQNSRVIIRDIDVQRHERFGIELNNTKHVLVDACFVSNATNLGGGGSGYGVIINGNNGTNNWVKSCTIGPVIRHGQIIQFSAHHNLIESNTYQGNSADCIDCHGEDEYSNEIRFNTIFGGHYNLANDTTPAGIGIGEWSGVEGTTTSHDNSGPNNWVHHNEVYDCEFGFRICNQSNFTYVEDNNFHDCLQAGIRADLNRLNNLFLDRNTVQNNAQGIQINDVTTLTCRNNIVTGNTGVGISTNANCTGYTITGNTVTGNGTNYSISGTGTFVP